jgi:phosphoglycerate dehydrogenase-like enzyme
MQSDKRKKAVRCLLTRHFFDSDVAYMGERMDPRIKLLVPHGYSDVTLMDMMDSPVEVFIGDVPGKEVLDRAEHLRLIQIPWTGVDNLDFDLLRRYGFTVCNSHSNATVVAEYAVSLMLSLLKGIPYHDAQLRRNHWCRPSAKEGNDFRPPEMIHGKTVGIIGCGAVGLQIARLLSSFGVTLIGLANLKRQNGHVPFDVMYDRDALDTVLAESDIVFLAVPLTRDTRNLINGASFRTMRRSAYLVNVSRGAVVNEKDFHEALHNGEIAGAAIDTWYAYPGRGETVASPSQYPFSMLPNVVLSPHRAGFGKGLLPHLDDVVENLNRYAANRPLLNVVDIERRY